jgi:hypothetical protein
MYDYYYVTIIIIIDLDSHNHRNCYLLQYCLVIYQLAYVNGHLIRLTLTTYISISLQRLDHVRLLSSQKYYILQVLHRKSRHSFRIQR